MKKMFIYLSVLGCMLLSARDAVGQKNGLKLSFGAASFRMDDMKILQEFILSTYPAEGRITSSFPPFSTFSATFVTHLYDQVQVGGGYSYATTGGKSSYADYSGNLVTDMTATSHRFGGYISYIVLGGDRLDLNLNGRLDANLTNMTVESYYQILNYSNGISNEYRSISPTGSIAAELNIKFGSFYWGLEAGYQVDLTGNLKSTDGGDALPDPYDGARTLTSDWTGWQVKLSAQVWLKR